MKVSFNHVHKRFDRFEAVKDLSLEVEDGELLVLLGPSGCGKTTALRMIAGLESVSEGDLYIGDRRVNSVLPKYRDVAMVFQSYALYPHMTVAQNIGYPLRIRKVPEAEQREQVLRVARQVQLDPLLERLPKQLSGGQRQRVALARAIIRRPSVFLMDEPLSNLDAKLRTHMRAELKHLQHQLGTTTIYVTHDQIEAMTLADRVAVMNEGKLRQLDVPEVIHNDPANLFVATFIGSPGMNFFRGDLRQGAFVSPRVTVAGVGSGDHPEVVLGVRPGDLALVAEGEGQFSAPIYSIEFTGNETIVTVEVGGEFVAVLADKGYRNQIDNHVHIRVDPAQSFLFDAKTENRLRFA